ncbi:MAG: hypothetical protein ACFWT4_19725 [Citrobacter braakii]
MAMSPPPIFEGNDYYSVSEEFFSKLPADLRAPFEQIMKKGAEIISGCDKEIESLIRLIKVIPTTTSLSYIYRRLRTTKFEITTESMMEQEMLTTAFVVSYARLFAKSNGTCVLQRMISLSTYGLFMMSCIKFATNVMLITEVITPYSGLVGLLVLALLPSITSLLR